MLKNNIVVLVKPTQECNLDCSYCYDKDEKHLIKNKKMPVETVKKISTLLKNAYKNVNWTWHGGEPLLVPVEQYEMYMAEINKTLKNVSFSMQSNGTLIDEKIDKFLEENKIDLSISYDYTNGNKNRNHEIKISDMDPEGKRSVINVIDLESSEFLINFYEKNKSSSRNISFNKIFLDKETDDNVELYTDNFIKYFNYYIYDNMCVKEDRMFKSFFEKIFGIRNKCSIMCNHEDCLNKFLSVNPDGFVFNCDRFGTNKADKYCFGNVDEYKFTMLEYKETQGYSNLVNDIIEFKKKCDGCEISSLCTGGCLADRVDSNGKIDVTIMDKNECYFNKKVYSFIFNTIFNLKKEELLDINPFVYEAIFENKIILKFMIDEIQGDVLNENININ
ncbi:MAG: radical SAM protein [Peptostreptococcaceae bacterium]